MRAASAFAAIALVLPTVPAAAADRALPYWASIVPSKARTRAGPGRNFPATWLYQRAGLPVKVVASVPNWRKIVDPDGAGGWMQANMLSERRTGMVRGATRRLYAEPSEGAGVAWRAQAGVLGLLSRCEGGWCILDVRGRKGYVRKGDIWGVDAGETFR